MIFGTDGVRGRINKEITAQVAYNIGKGLAISILNKKINKKIIIGMDTRISGYTYLSAISCALSDYGINVVFVGIVPTPVISFLVSRCDFSGGIMITASHNDYNYNGIKVFDEFGNKINKLYENEIIKNITSNRIKTKYKGKIEYNNNYISYYIKYLLDNFKIDLSNLTIVLDCANGANYEIAPFVFKQMGANLIKINSNNDGLKINHKCGANNVSKLIKEVKYHNADFGIAFDGDGDRLIIILKNGRVLNGDDLLLYFALCLNANNELNKFTVVGTISTNSGLEQSLNNYGIKLLRTDVGDKNIINNIISYQLSLGGETSGHICIHKFSNSCDALLNSLFFIKCYQENKINFDQFLNSIINFPTLSENIKVSENSTKKFCNDTNFKNEILQLEKEFDNSKIIVRPSGTEPVIRILIESDHDLKNKKILEKVVNLIKSKV